MGVMVAFVQMPCKSGWPSGVRGPVQVLAANDTVIEAANIAIEGRKAGETACPTNPASALTQGGAGVFACLPNFSQLVTTNFLGATYLNVTSRTVCEEARTSAPRQTPRT